MSLIQKSDPPPSKKFASEVPWDEIVRVIDAEPGTWFLIGEFSPGVPTHIRSGRYKAFLKDYSGSDPRGYMERTYEVTTRKSGDDPDRKRVNIWIRRK